MVSCKNPWYVTSLAEVTHIKYYRPGLQARDKVIKDGFSFHLLPYIMPSYDDEKAGSTQNNVC